MLNSPRRDAIYCGIVFLLTIVLLLAVPAIVNRSI